MDRFVVSPPTRRGLGTPGFRPYGYLLLGVLLAILLLGGLSAGPMAAPLARSAPHATPAVVAPFVTHGDLVVTAANSPFTIKPLSGSPVYYQQGNITVQPGGTLIVQSSVIDFVQFVGSTGTIAQRLSHLYHFLDLGTVHLLNSSITTDSYVLNPYTKLNTNVSGGGTFTANGSSLEFPGWINVYGAGSSMTLNGSSIRPNPDIFLNTARLNWTVKNDTRWAAALWAGGGAHVTLANSQYFGSNRFNVSRYGVPGPGPLESSGGALISSGGGATLSSFPVGPVDSENLTKYVLYNGVASGSVSIFYNTTVTQSAAAGNQFVYGSTIGLGGVTYSSANTVVQVALPASALALINQAGFASFLVALSSGGVSVNLGATNSATPVTVSSVAFNFYPLISYNITATGAGTTVTAVNTLLDLNWNLTPGSPVTGQTPYPWSWSSHKLLLTQGAQGYLANITVPTNDTDQFWNSSAVLPDPSSVANFYRWLSIPVTGAAGLPVLGAQTTAFYAYDASTTNNATANTLNNLATADPDLFNAVSAWDKVHGIAQYGASAPNGFAYQLLATSQLSQSTLPDGWFLGSYHVAVTAPNPKAGGTNWFYAGVTPYPHAMNPAGPDLAPGVNYPNYRPLLAVTAVGLTVNAQANANQSVAIGETLGVTTVISNVGTGSVSTFAATFAYVRPFPAPLWYVAKNQTFPAGLAPGVNKTLNFSWVVNETVVGRHPGFNATFLLNISWNGGVGPNAGSVTDQVPVRIVPSYISIRWVPPSGNLNPGTTITSAGTIHFSGTGAALINITASNGEALYYLAQLQATPGNFTSDIVIPAVLPNGMYSVTVTGYYNHRTVSYNFTNQFTVGVTTSPATNFWDQKILGLLPLWLLLVIVAVGVAAAVGALALLRQQARGKLVECGECGELIPEDATVCPKCGAEFETELVRCSRCGSTIPASSKVCPECSAVLLGKGAEAEKDPERQGYSDFVERFRGDARKELQDNYSEGAFWDWWKRQPTYISFSQWRLQQAQGSRAGMTAPPAEAAAVEPARAQAPRTPPRQGGGGAGGGTMAPAAARPAQAAARPAVPRAAPAPAAMAPQPTAAAPATPAPTGPVAPMKACSNCGKEIPPEYLVCPFCGAVTQ